MSLSRSAALARISRQLHDAEKTTDLALKAAADLMSTLIDARSGDDVAPHTGQRALIRLARAQAAILDGSSDIFRVHDIMANIGKEMAIFEEAQPTRPAALVDADNVRRVA